MNDYPLMSYCPNCASELEPMSNMFKNMNWIKCVCKACKREYTSKLRADVRKEYERRCKNENIILRDYVMRSAKVESQIDENT